MNEQHQVVIDKLNRTLNDFYSMTSAPEQEHVKLCIEEIYSEINSLNEDDNPYLSRHTILEYLYDLADIVCGFAELFENKFINSLNALNFRNMELKIAKQYKLSGGADFLRDIWEIHLDISRHYLALNIDNKSLSNAKTALNLFQKDRNNTNPRDLSYIYRRIAFAYQDIAPDKAIIYFRKSTNVLNVYNNSNELFENYLDIAVNNANIAIIMYDINQSEDMVPILNECIKSLNGVLVKYGENETAIYYLSIINGILANAYFQIGEYEKTIQTADDGLALYDNIKNSYSLSCEAADILYTAKGLALRNLEKYMEAIEVQYKLLAVWTNFNGDEFVRSCRISDIYVDISLIFSKYLEEQGMAIEAARLSIKEIRPYRYSELFKSNKKALTTRRRSFINLADAYRRAKMNQSALTSYKAALDIIREELELGAGGSEKISLVYSYAYTLYQVAMLYFKFNRTSDGCKYLSHAYKNICSLKKYGGRFELLYDLVHNALITYDKKFDGKLVELEDA